MNKKLKIIKAVADPYEETLVPGLQFYIKVTYETDEAIIGVSGWLESDDGTKIAEIIDLAPTDYFELSTEQLKAEKSYDTYVLALLDQRALNYIETIRMANANKSVVLYLNLNIRMIESKVVYEDQSLTVVRSDKPFLRVFTESPPNYKIEIDLVHWINNYAPKLGLGEFFIVELPKGDKTIESAWGHIEEAEDAFRKWDASGVCSKCREVGKALDKAIKDSFGESSFTYNERWGRTYLRFFNYVVAIGLHLEDFTDAEWEENIKKLPNGFPKPKRKGDYPKEEIKRIQNRPDAEHILLITKALIKYAEELLREGEG